MQKIILAVLAAMLIAGFAGPGIAGVHQKAITPTVCVGARANQDGADSVTDVAHNEANFLALQTALGKSLCIDSEYEHDDEFSVALPLTQAQWDVANGYVPMVTWFLNATGGPCRKLTDITAGMYDADYTDKAAALAAVGGNVLVRLDPAMDTQGRQCMYDYDVLQDPQDAGPQFVAAWQHIVGLVTPLAPNVRWNWSPGNAAFNSNGNPDTRWQYFWPGPSYVDWAGVEAYQSDPNTIEGFQDDAGINNWYSQASLLGKPMILSETGAAGPDPQQDANGYGCTYSTGLTSPSPEQKWLSSMSSHLSADYPAIHAFVWFDTVGNGGPLNCINYTLRGGGVTAMSNMLAKIYFQANTLP